MIIPQYTSPRLHKHRFMSTSPSSSITRHTVKTWPQVIIICNQNFKTHLRGTRFRDDDELKAATEAWFWDQTDNFYFKGIDCLTEKWAKYIEVKGDYNY